MVANAVFESLLRELARAYCILEDASVWNINVYFNRIVTRKGEVGRPVPEGKHRDGVKFSCLFMSQRIGCGGGETSLIDMITHEPVLIWTLKEAGACVIFRDDTVLHDTSPIFATLDDQPGFRDVLVVEFY